MTHKKGMGIAQNFGRNLDKTGEKIGKGVSKVIDELEGLSEMGFTKKRTRANRSKNDPFHRAGI